MQILPRPALISLLAALAGCAHPQPSPAPMVGGGCRYSSQATSFTALGVLAHTDTSAEVIFRGVAADLPEATKTAVFIASFVKPDMPVIDTGLPYPGKIETITSGTCTPTAYAVIINGNSYGLEARTK
jgi:hypothetical protein